MLPPITSTDLFHIAQGADAGIIAGIVKHQTLLAKSGIDTPKRLCHFLGQIACESAGFTRLEENLFYTTADRLKAVWPSRFKTDSEALPYLRNPQKLANFVYGGRLGNKKPGDGWKYRGSGLKQTTGFTNFQIVQTETGIPCVADPDLLRHMPSALEAACVYWRTNNLNRFADADDIRGLTRAIQGGSGGLDLRRRYTERAEQIYIAGERAPVPPLPSMMLRRGNSGEAVRELQRLLAAHGFEIRIDGVFGPGTEDILQQFQERAGLMPDGVAGPKTMAALSAPTADQPEAGQPQTDPVPVIPAEPGAPEALSLPKLITTIIMIVIAAIAAFIGG